MTFIIKVILSNRPRADWFKGGCQQERGGQGAQRGLQPTAFSVLTVSLHPFLFICFHQTGAQAATTGVPTQYICALPPGGSTQLLQAV